MKKGTFTYPSSDGKTTVYAAEYIPDGPVRAVVQICHGMCEYVERYDDFAAFLASNGFYVVGNDHVGHGRSVVSDERLGFFEEGMKSACLVNDMRTLHLQTVEKYSDVPYFLLGHSMGSFLTRRYIARYGSELKGALILGTGYQAYTSLSTGLSLCRFIARKNGESYRSGTVYNMAFGSYNKRFEPLRTEYDWLSKDKTVVDKYKEDPFCTYLFTVNGYYGLFRSIWYAQKTTNLIPKDLPVYLLSGTDDPVGDYGKGVRRVYKKMLGCGMQNVEMKLYEGDRHEILNETDKDIVYNDILEWINEHM